MANWDYKRTERTFSKIPVGRHRMRIEQAEMTVSSKGNDMVVLTLSVSGMSRTIRHYIVFMENNPDMTNQKFTEVFDSFGIEEGEFDLAKWAGHVGAGQTKYDENEYEKVQYFIARKRQSDLPAWVEPKLPESVREIRAGGSGGYPLPNDDADLPF